MILRLQSKSMAGAIQTQNWKDELRFGHVLLFGCFSTELLNLPAAPLLCGDAELVDGVGGR